VTVTAIEILVAPHTATVGGAPVARVLPRIQRRTVGPFVFFDHFGPQTLREGARFDVAPHPHIGLATVTYLLAGAALHRDSLGSHQRIEPGALNLMTAGRGIVHSERTPDDVGPGAVLHGLQFWVGLPSADEECEPTFVHHAASVIPKWDDRGVSFALPLGSAFGRTSPARSPGEPFLLDVRLAPGADLKLPSFGEGIERAVYPIEGPLELDGFALPAQHLAVVAARSVPVLSAPSGGRFVVLGGPPLDGPRYLDWNFVSSSKERLARARADWIARRFPLVPGDEAERVPHPAEAT
jgi:redox-sensitive bicupin YhaK (pirin superfamily)